MLYRPALAREVPKSTPRPPLQSKNESDSFLPIRASSAPRSLPKEPELSTHQNFLKQLLELDAKSLDYRRKEGSRNSNMPSFSEPQVEKAESEEKAPLELHEIHYLITTGDMNNYYTSLLSWCPLSQKLALGINEDAYWWDGELTVERLWNNGRYFIHHLFEVWRRFCTCSSGKRKGHDNGCFGVLQRAVFYRSRHSLCCVEPGLFLCGRQRGYHLQYQSEGRIDSDSLMPRISPAGNGYVKLALYMLNPNSRYNRQQGWPILSSWWKRE